MDSDSPEVKKLKVSNSVDDALEDAINKQSVKLFATRHMLENNCNNADLEQILATNRSGLVEGLLDRCADFLTFGALAKCQKCLNGDLVFAKYGYKCNEMVDEWIECDNFVTKPLRIKCKLPAAVARKLPKEISNFKSNLEDRVVRPGILKTAKDLNKEEAEKRAVNVNRKREPLYNMHVVAIGKLLMPKDQLKRCIEDMGGKLTTTLQSMIAVVISTEEEIDKMNIRMQKVKELRIQVVPEDFLRAIRKGSPIDTMEKIKCMEISDWGSDPMARMPPDEVKGPRVRIFGGISFVLLKLFVSRNPFISVVHPKLPLLH